MVATQHQGDDGLLAVLVRFRQYQQGLGDGGRGHAQEGGHFVYGVHRRGGNLGQGFGCGSALASRRQGFGHLDVGGVVGAVGEGDQVFTALGQHLEFVGASTADGAGIGLHRTEVQTHAGERLAVGGVHLLVGIDQRLFVDVEGVGVLHQEFTATHHAETGAYFVAELGLDLVEVERQLLVAVHFVTDQGGDHLFVGRAQHEGAVVAVGQAAQLGTVVIPAAGLLPQLGGLHHRHGDFDGTSIVHLFANNVLDLFQYPQTGWQPGVHAGGQFTDHPGAQHQLVADDFSVGGGFLESGKQILAGTHRGRPSLVRALGPGKFQVRNFNRLSPVAQGLNSARRRERGRFGTGPGARAGEGEREIAGQALCWILIQLFFML
ncbi:hypothetical protein D3C75_567080 [compost metagenome]